jgi:hypothetical protein
MSFVKNNVTSRLDATRRRVKVPHVEIGGRVAEKDAMERVAIELAGRSPETREVTREPKARKWDRSGFSLLLSGHLCA